MGGGYWEAQPAEVSKNKIKRASKTQVALLAAISKNGYDLSLKPYDTVRGLDTAQESVLRGHWLPDHAPAFPVAGFQGAITRGAVQYSGKNYGIPAIKLRALTLFGDATNTALARIKTSAVMFNDINGEDMGTSSGMVRSPRMIVRLCYDLPWETTLRVRFNSALFTAQQVLQAFVWGGDFGVGQWRPSSPHGGQHGTFRVAGAQD